MLFCAPTRNFLWSDWWCATPCLINIAFKYVQCRREGGGIKPVRITGAPQCCICFAFLTGTSTCRLYKLALPDQTKPLSTVQISPARPDQTKPLSLCNWQSVFQIYCKDFELVRPCWGPKNSLHHGLNPPLASLSTLATIYCSIYYSIYCSMYYIISSIYCSTYCSIHCSMYYRIVVYTVIRTII